MREVLVTREDVLKAMEASERGEYLTSSCAMHQALKPFIVGEFTVIDSQVYSKNKRQRNYFTPSLPQALYTGQFEESLTYIEANGPYKFQVEGI